MRETEEKAKSGMIKFVIAIFTIAVSIALGYFVFLTPGEPHQLPSAHDDAGGG